MSDALAHSGGQVGTGHQRFPAWGKLSRDKAGQVSSEHPLLDHMTDVAACFLALAECTAIRRSMEKTAGRALDAADLQRLAVLVFLHDVGKANAGFQSQRWRLPDRPPGSWPTTPLGHGPEGWELISGRVLNAEHYAVGLPIAEIVAWGEVAVSELLQASISHHGRPLGESPDKQTESIWKPVLDKTGAVLYDPATTLASMGERVKQSYPLAFSECHQPLPDQPAFVHLFAGLVQLADWLGSDTREGFFPYTVPGEDRTHTAAVGAQYAVHAIGLDVNNWRDELCGERPTFSDAFDVPEARPMQLAAADLSLGNIVVLEAETGSGKTEAALWRFVQLFEAGKIDSLYFALPTRVAATQLYQRVLALVSRLWPTDAPVVVRALPGYEAADDQEKISLPDFKVQWPDHPADEKAHQRWVAESPKRFLAATIAVGTIDQALLGALKVRHAHMRHALLARSLLVVDEVHASDAYMTVLLEKLLQAHLKTGGQAMLLSATLGSSARTRYLSIGQSMKQALPSLADACAAPYPAVSFRNASGMHLQPVAGNPQHKTVYWETLDAMDDPVRIATLAAQAAAQGARVLVVRNTVPAAVATLKALEQLTLAQGGDWLFKVNGISTVHHSRYSRQDRPLLDKAVEAQLGKTRKDSQGRVIIGTQTLEQSLDIDADLLITDLCPMDVLLQRLGRLHRHARPEAERSEGYRQPRAWVLTPAGNDLTPMFKRARHGLGRFHDGGGVYPDLRMIEVTKRLIQAQFSREIPADNRALVELATHTEALKAIEQELGATWQKHGQTIEGEISALRAIGHLQMLQFDDAFSDAFFPDGDQKISTRIGAADRLVTFDPPLPGPFQQEVKQLALRAYEAEGVSLDAGPTGVAIFPDHFGFEFMFGDTSYRYSRFGLERLKTDDQNQPTQGETV
ncbi:CRISPR-associated helicase Cas3' [Rhodoferax sp.]|uniref:CRISPR-associated helicase Cas3' n=1 Tax=Rhodoferax sp. TaxID=50421 RepID=UPI00260B7357|nr:CRISPR-associated helicase Cas3' [Rhodoferax sp.]MDD5000355.1 CRISPR-associated helicase Cas3' [Thiomonas arsenitoxydans]MDD5480271.1 CRISPR-associated helicase Cas3' [Rhodoferax sp.]